MKAVKFWGIPASHRFDRGAEPDLSDLSPACSKQFDFGRVSVVLPGGNPMTKRLSDGIVLSVTEVNTRT